MTAVSLEKAPVRYVEVGDIGRNSARVSGGICTTPELAPIHAGGLVWLPDHAAPHSASIGYALAIEASRA